MKSPQIDLTPEVRVLNGKRVRFYTPQQLDEIRNLSAPDFQRERAIRHSHALAAPGVIPSQGYRKLGSTSLPV